MNCALVNTVLCREAIACGRMRLVCAEHDRLRAEYDAALESYLAVVNTFGQTRQSVEAMTVAADARGIADYARIGFRTHCLTCGCDPEWIEADDRRLQDR